MDLDPSLPKHYKVMWRRPYVVGDEHIDRDSETVFDGISIFDHHGIVGRIVPKMDGVLD